MDSDGRLKNKQGPVWKAGLLGAGYIAAHHVKALQRLPFVKIGAICDRNIHQMKRLKSTAGKGVLLYDNLEEMLKDENLDVIHVLLPPDFHYSCATEILHAGKHVFLEKPMCIEAEECEKLGQLALSRHLQLGINHNFLFYEVYQQLKACLNAHEIGPLDHLTLAWNKNLGALHSGPYNIWMLRDPQNLMIEVGPHLTACVQDLVGDFDIKKAEVSDPLVLPNGTTIYRRWMAVGEAGRCGIELKFSFADGFESHTLEARGSIGSAKVDFEKNSFIHSRHTDSTRPFDLYHMANKEAGQIIRDSRRTLRNYILSKCGLSEAGDPYFGSILNSIRSFYEHLPNSPVPSQSSYFSTQVIGQCRRIIEAAGVKEKKASIRVKSSEAASMNPQILITGGTGFIGKALVKALTDRGILVRLLIRNPDSAALFTDYPLVEIVQGDLRDRNSLKKALEGIQTVYHLARANVKKWDEYVEEGVKGTKFLAEECLYASVGRLIYTGTIDSYYAGEAGSIITEETPLDPQIDSRNYYARAKAAEEKLLMEMHRGQSLPVVILRPGIVLGIGSSPFHWGVGMWHYGSICQLWGKGDNFLPFVWVDDVVKALISAKKIPRLEGESFNIIDKPLLSGQEYAVELSRSLQARLEIVPTPIWKFYLYDYWKWIIKLLVRHQDRKRPSYRDWSSRTQLAQYDCRKAFEILNWRPLSDKQKLIEEGIEKPSKEWIK